MKRLVLALLTVSLSSSGQHAGPARTGATSSAWQYTRVGAAQNIQVKARAGYALMGGGTDLDEAFSWLCDHAAGGDFLVLRAAGTDAYNPWIAKLCRVNSVATLILPSREAASDPAVAKTIAGAAAIFIAGGDQARYTNFWAGTPVEAALREAVKRGIPIGGTSAGLAVLGEYIYSAQNDAPDGPDLTSDVALSDPFAKQVVIAPDLLGIPSLREVITDSHFDTRHREGRLLVFMARILASSGAKTIRGIGVDERTALLVEADGSAKVAGSGSVQFYEAAGARVDCRPRVALTFGPVESARIGAGGSGNLQTIFTGTQRVFVQSGNVRVSPEGSRGGW
jgi:cyanophycinase